MSLAFIIAGQAVAMQTGLVFASMVDPVSGTNAPVVGQFFNVPTTLIFLALDGHLVFMRLLLFSFETIPVGPQSFTPQELSCLIYFGAVMFQGALAMSISAICTMLVVNFTFGVMTRASPQLTAFMGNFTLVINALMENTCSLMGTSCTGVW